MGRLTKEQDAELAEWLNCSTLVERLSPDESVACLQEMRDRPKCSHFYRHGPNTPGTLVRDIHYADDRRNHPEQYRCVRCSRIMRKSQTTGFMYYLRCVHDKATTGPATGERCNAPAVVAFYNPQTSRPMYSSSAICIDFVCMRHLEASWAVGCSWFKVTPPEPKPKQIKTILRKRKNP